MPRLRQVDCSAPGIIRRPRGRGFEYLDLSGKRIDDAEVLQRIKDLAIPPAWKGVWICPQANGHLQAVGTDAAGRKQYLYHERWRQRRDLEKFDRMIEFAEELPALRKTIAGHLSLQGFPRERVLACAVRLLDRGFFRIGSEDYAEENQTYGLATMKKRHATVEGHLVEFKYRSKGGQRRIQSIVDPPVAEIVAALRKRRSGGDELLAYKQLRRWVDVRSSDINDYIKETTRGEFTSKDFRTWNATVLCAVALAVSGEMIASKTGRKRAMARAAKEVAHYLGNTPAVCRSAYIDPRVFDRYRSRWTVAPALEQLGEGAVFGDLATQGAIESAVLDLLERRLDSSSVEKVA
ncbi:MAG: DNA topoisomerase IB [Actinomycetota bacterium]